MDPNQPRWVGYRTKEQAKKRRHDAPAPVNPPMEPEVVIAPNPNAPIPNPEELIILTDSDTSDIETSSPPAEQSRGKEVATSSAVSSSSSDEEYVPPPSFEYNEEVQADYAARRARRVKGKGVASSSGSSNPKRQVLPKPKPQVLGLVCARAFVYIARKGQQSLPCTANLQALARDDLSDD